MCTRILYFAGRMLSKRPKPKWPHRARVLRKIFRWTVRRTSARRQQLTWAWTTWDIWHIITLTTAIPAIPAMPAMVIPMVISTRTSIRTAILTAMDPPASWWASSAKLATASRTYLPGQRRRRLRLSRPSTRLTPCCRTPSKTRCCLTWPIT